VGGGRHELEKFWKGLSAFLDLVELRFSWLRFKSLGFSKSLKLFVEEWLVILVTCLCCYRVCL
jgi:hypothetical protein